MQIRKESHLHIYAPSMILISPIEAHRTTYDNRDKNLRRSNLSKWCWHGLSPERKVPVKWHHETSVRSSWNDSFTRSRVPSLATIQWKPEIQSPRRLFWWHSSIEEGDLSPSIIVVRSSRFSRNWNRPKTRIVISVQRTDVWKKTTCENEKRSTLSTIQQRSLAFYWKWESTGRSFSGWWSPSNIRWIGHRSK